jgi:hypothetical protein
MAVSQRYSYQEMKDLGLTDAEIEVCRVMRMDPQVFKKTKELCSDPRNIDPRTGNVMWQNHQSMPLTSREEAMARAREAWSDEDPILLVDKSSLEIF